MKLPIVWGSRMRSTVCGVSWLSLFPGRRLEISTDQERVYVCGRIMKGHVRLDAVGCIAALPGGDVDGFTHFGRDLELHELPQHLLHEGVGWV